MERIITLSTKTEEKITLIYRMILIGFKNMTVGGFERNKPKFQDGR